MTNKPARNAANSESSSNLFSFWIQAAETALAQIRAREPRRQPPQPPWPNQPASKLLRPNKTTSHSESSQATHASKIQYRVSSTPITFHVSRIMAKTEVILTHN